MKVKFRDYIKTKDNRSNQLKRGWLLRHFRIDENGEEKIF
jgi:hypothetical protein